MQNPTTENHTAAESSSPPTPDFSSLRSAAATLRTFGAEPVPLLKGFGRNGPQKKDAQPTDSRPEDQGEKGGEETDGPDWGRAGGVGVVAGQNGWNGLLVKPPSLRTIVSSLRIKHSNNAWIARNDESALIYFRTDASPTTVRALAAIYQAVGPKSVTAGTDVPSFGTRDEEGSVLPVPPSPNLPGGHWSFVGEVPEGPPPYKAFRVGAKALSEGYKGKNRGRSDVLPDVIAAENYSQQTYQARSKSKWILGKRDDGPTVDSPPSG